MLKSNSDTQASKKVKKTGRMIGTKGRRQIQQYTWISPLHQGPELLQHLQLHGVTSRHYDITLLYSKYIFHIYRILSGAHPLFKHQNHRYSALHDFVSTREATHQQRRNLS